MVPLRNKGTETFYGTYYPSICGRRSDDRLYDVKKVLSSAGKRVTIKQPHSFSILPGAVVRVHDVALHLPQVKAARKSGWLERVLPEEAATLEHAAAKAAVAQAADKTAKAAAEEAKVAKDKADAAKAQTKKGRK